MKKLLIVYCLLSIVYCIKIQGQDAADSTLIARKQAELRQIQFQAQQIEAAIKKLEDSFYKQFYRLTDKLRDAVNLQIVKMGEIEKLSGKGEGEKRRGGELEKGRVGEGESWRRGELEKGRKGEAVKGRKEDR